MNIAWARDDRFWKWIDLPNDDFTEKYGYKIHMIFLPLRPKVSISGLLWLAFVLCFLLVFDVVALPRQLNSNR